MVRKVKLIGGRINIAPFVVASRSQSQSMRRSGSRSLLSSNYLHGNQKSLSPTTLFEHPIL